MAKRIDDDDDGLDIEPNMVAVTLPSGAAYQVHKLEKDEFNKRINKYMEDNLFTNASDLGDLDRIMQLEQQTFRFSLWLSTMKNYDGEGVDDKQLTEQIKQNSTEIRQLKQSLGLDKVSRDKQKGVEDVSDYIQNLLRRAKQFHYKRNAEFGEMMEIFNEFRGLIQLYDNMDEQERREYAIKIGPGRNGVPGKNMVTGLTPDVLIRWFREMAEQRVDEIDRKFRQETPEGVTGADLEATEGGQRQWITDM